MAVGVFQRRKREKVEERLNGWSEQGWEVIPIQCFAWKYQWDQCAGQTFPDS